MATTLRGGHEPLSFTDEHVTASPRAFGITFAVVFTIYAVWPMWDGGAARSWATILAGAFLVTALLVPRVLVPLSNAWQKVGVLLHYVVNPIVMGVLFYLAVTPFGLLTRWRKPTWATRFRVDRAAPTYWIPRSASPISMRQQF